jgi:Na+-transporting NADH:ubiquinone oxidoreductase subunit A
LEIRIDADEKIDYFKFGLPKLETLKKDEIIEALLKSGLWVAIKQRPYGIIPDPKVEPRSIFISGFNSAPLAPDYDYTLREDFGVIQVAINALSKLCKERIHIGLNAITHASTPFHKLKNVDFNIFDGPHPVGNVGVQIHHVAPINKGEVVWTISMPMLASIGKLFLNDIYDMSRMVAITGPRVDKPAYIKGVAGMKIDFLSKYLSDEPFKSRKDCPVRYISGDILTGTQIAKDGYLGFYDTQLTLLTEGSYYESFGWAKPFRMRKFSFSSTYLSSLFPNREYKLDTNTNGEERAFVVTGKYEKVFPMNIFPVYLLKAILAEDIDKMEQLGIYEVIEEDFALCEYICPSKIDLQAIISKGIDLMIKEMA